MPIVQLGKPVSHDDIQAGRCEWDRQVVDLPGVAVNTWCYVGLMESKHKKRPVADLIVSLLKPTNWKRMLRVKAIHPDEPGVVSKAIAAFKNLNIALAESVTIDAGDSHAVTFFLEAVKADKPPSAEQLRKTLVARGFRNVAVDPYSDSTIRWMNTGEIRGGWIRNLDWRLEMNKWYPDEDNIDFNKVVASADTTTRMLRFTFPYKNARTIRVEHSDEPKFLKQITDVDSKSLPSNIDGIYSYRFSSGQDALSTSNPDSIHQIIVNWLKRVRELASATRSAGFVA